MAAEKIANISEKTQVPMGWVIALVIGCAGFTGTAVAVGMYFGGRDANATALTERVATVEQRVDVLERVETRLARIEGKLGIYTSPEDSLRVPANTK